MCASKKMIDRMLQQESDFYRKEIEKITQLSHLMRENSLQAIAIAKEKLADTSFPSGLKKQIYLICDIQRNKQYPIFRVIMIRLDNTVSDKTLEWEIYAFKGRLLRPAQLLLPKKYMPFFSFKDEELHLPPDTSDFKLAPPPFKKRKLTNT